ncbi:hypothetical protein P8452_12717 [Trifolium repens]|nr:hypothetical protein P8452_12717 [Trifolium repens]
MMLSNCTISTKVISLDYISSRVSEVGLAAFFYKTAFGQKQCSSCFSSHFAQPCLLVHFKRKTWSVRSSINDSSFSPSNGTNGRTRIIRVIQEFQTKLGSKIEKVPGEIYRILYQPYDKDDWRGKSDIPENLE